MNKQEAQVAAARQLLRAHIKASKYTVKQVAAAIGEEYTGLSKRLSGHVAGYQGLDTSTVVNVCALLNIPVSEFFKQVEARAAELLEEE